MCRAGWCPLLARTRYFGRVSHACFLSPSSNSAAVCTDPLPVGVRACSPRCECDPGRWAARGHARQGSCEPGGSVSKMCLGLLILHKIPAAEAGGGPLGAGWRLTMTLWPSQQGQRVCARQLGGSRAQL